MERITEIIKYEGDNNTFIWKHPSEDFNTMTQLIVHESQEAIFFMNGQALDMFGPGRYTLETQNIPLLSKIFTKQTGGATPFHCEVYFINKTVQMGIKWGTPERVRLVEPTYGLPISIGASGEMNLMVCDSRKLLVKLVGTTCGIAWSEQGQGFTRSLENSFRPIIATAVKTHLATGIKAQNINVIEIDEHLEELSESLRQKISESFEEYGITIPQLYITNISLPENDPNFEQLRALHTVSLKKKMIAADAEIQTASVEAETKVKTAQAESDATVTAAKRKAVLESETTKTEIAKQEAERELIDAKAKADAERAMGYADADVMKAKGYTQKDVFQRDAQVAFAEGLGNAGANGGGGMVGDIVGLGVGLAAAGQVGAQVGGMVQSLASPAQPEIKCHNCGNALPSNAKFCLECGTKVEQLAENETVCPECGKKTLKGKFCMECGAALIRKCGKCGAELPEGAKFCPECGEKL